MAGRHHTFISYNRRDSHAAYAIARQLEAHGIRVFIDTWRLTPGQSWPALLEKHLAECTSFVIVVGGHGLGAWQRRECYMALERQARENALPVIPTLVPGADDPALGFLGLNTWADLRSGFADDDAVGRLIAAVKGEEAADAGPDPRQEICPYRGLEPFREEDAAFFFGRDLFTRRLADQVQNHALVAVVGASGSGKSSVVRAGLVPHLRRRQNGTVWDVAVLRPGAEPLAALVRALDPPPADLGLTEARARLNRGATRLRDAEVTLDQLVRDNLESQPGTDRILLVIDQFEELWTLSTGVEERERFIDLLLEAAIPGGPLRVVVTLRSDFYTDVLARRDLLERVQDAVVNVGPLSREAGGDGKSELEAVIRKPAEAVGLRFEEGLVERILGDVGANPGELPLLEYLLTELWRRREGERLTHAAFDAIGGVSGSVARRAEDAYSSLSDPEKVAAKRLFLSLVRPGAGQPDTRVRAAYPMDPDEVAAANRFAGPKLRHLVVGEEETAGRFVDLAHETLIRNWARLGSWIDENRDRLRILDRIRARQRRWREEGDPDDLLLPRGLELEEGHVLLDAADEIPVGEVRAYIERSIAAAEARDRAERERELASQRQKRNIFVAAFVVCLAFLAAAAWQWRTSEELRVMAEGERQTALLARNDAQEQRDKAQAAEAQAEAEADRAVATLLASAAERVLEENTGEASVAAMVAVDSLQRRETPEARGVLRDALSLAPLGAALAPTPWANVDVAISPDGRVVAFNEYYSLDGGPVRSTLVRLDGSLAETFAEDFEGFAEPTLSPNGRWLVASGETWRLIVMDAATGERVVDRPTRGNVHVAFAPDGSTLYAATQVGEILRYDTGSWEALEPFTFPVNGVRRGRRLHVGVTRDGSQLLVLEQGRTAHVVETADGQVTHIPVRPNNESDWGRWRHPRGAVVSPTAKTALIYDSRGAGALWDLESATVVWKYDDGWEGRLYNRHAVAFSSDGRWAARGSAEGLLIVSDTADGSEIARWTYGAEISAVAFLDGERIAAAGHDGLTVWSVQGTAPPVRCAAGTEILSFAATDGLIVLGTADSQLLHCNAGTGEIVGEHRLDAPAVELAAGDDRRGLAATIFSGENRENWTELAFVERETGRELSRIVKNGGIRQVVLSPDGSLAAGRATVPERIVVWDTATGQERSSRDVDGGIAGFSPDGTRLRLGDHAARTLDLASGTLSEGMGERGGVWDILAKPFSDIVVTRGDDADASGEYVMRAWDLATEKVLWDIPSRGMLAPGGAAYEVWDDETGTHSVRAREDDRLIGRFVTKGWPADARLSPGGRHALTVNQTLSDADVAVYRTAFWDVEAGTPVWTRDQPKTTGPPPRVWQIADDYFGIQRLIYGDGVRAQLEVRRWQDGATVFTRDWTTGSMAIPVADMSGTELLISVPGVGTELRNLPSGEVAWHVEGVEFEKATFLPDGERIALGYTLGYSGNHRVELRDRQSGDKLNGWDSPGGLMDLSATADGRGVIAAVSSDEWSGLRVWDAATGDKLEQLEMDASPDHVHPMKNPEHVLVRDLSSGARIFDLGDGSEIGRLVHTIRSGKDAFATRAERAVTASEASLRYWNTATGEEIDHMTALGDIQSIAISPDGSRVALVTERQRLSAQGAEYEALDIWQPDADGLVETLPAENVSRVLFDPSGRWIALLGSSGSYVRVVDAATLLTGFTATPLKTGSFGTATDTVSFTSDGRYMILSEAANYGDGGMGGRRNTLRAFDLETKSEVARIDVDAHSGTKATGPGGFYYRGHDDRLRWIDLPPAQLDPMHKLDEAGYTLLSIPGTSRVLVKGDRLIDLDTGVETELTEPDDGLDTATAAVDRQARYIALSRYEEEWSKDRLGTVFVFDATSGALLAQTTDLPLLAHGMAFLEDGETLVIAEHDNTLLSEPGQTGDVYLLNWRTGALIRVGTDVIASEIVSARDVGRFATSEGIFDSDTGEEHAPRQVRVWSAEDGDPVLTRSNDLYGANIRLSDDGRRAAIFDAASPTKGEVVEIREGAPPVPLVTVERADSAHWARPVGFIDGGRRFVLGEAAGARIFDLETGAFQRLRESERPKRYALSPDGGYLAMAGDGYVSLWDTARAERLARFALERPRALAFTGADGDELVVLTSDGLVRPIWQADRLTEIACKVFAGDAWLDGRWRVTAANELGPCEPTLVGR